MPGAGWQVRQTAHAFHLSLSRLPALRTVGEEVSLCSNDIIIKLLMAALSNTERLLLALIWLQGNKRGERGGS